VISKYFYKLLSKLVGICFSILNLILFGNLPPLGSVCIIVENQGKFLVVERHKGQYVFPGGFIRWREHPTQAAQRECREETGLEIKELHLIGCSANPSDRFGRLGTISIIYDAEVIGGELHGSIEGQPRWLDETALPAFLYTEHVGVYEHYCTCKEFFSRLHPQLDS
jgi:8-oxo-dGTP diphosphatase